jgi:hypothetical protein
MCSNVRCSRRAIWGWRVLRTRSYLTRPQLNLGVRCANLLNDTSLLLWLRHHGCRGRTDRAGPSRAGRQPSRENRLVVRRAGTPRPMRRSLSVAGRAARTHSCTAYSTRWSSGRRSAQITRQSFGGAPRRAPDSRRRILLTRPPSSAAARHASNESLQLTGSYGWRVLRTRSYFIPCN